MFFCRPDIILFDMRVNICYNIFNYDFRIKEVRAWKIPVEVTNVIKQSGKENHHARKP